MIKDFHKLTSVSMILMIILLVSCADAIVAPTTRQHVEVTTQIEPTVTTIVEPTTQVISVPKIELTPELAPTATADTEEGETPVEKEVPVEEEVVEIVEETQPETTYTHEEIITAFPENSTLGKAVRYETAEFEDGEMPRFVYFVDNGVAKKVDISNPTFIESEGRLQVNLENGGSIVWNEITGWVIPQFSSTGWGSKTEGFVTVSLDVDHLTRKHGQEVYPLKGDDEIIPTLGIRPTTMDDYYNDEWYEQYRMLTPETREWYDKFGYPLENSPLLTDPESPREILDAEATTAFSIMFFGRADISNAELLAVKNYTFGEPTNEDLELLSNGFNFENGLPLSVETSKGTWVLENGIDLIATSTPENSGGWYLGKIGSKAAEPFHIINGKAFIVVPILRQNSWGLASGFRMGLAVEIGDQNIDPDHGYDTGIGLYTALLGSSMSIVEGKDGKVVFSPFITLEAINPAIEGDGEINEIPVSGKP